MFFESACIPIPSEAILPFGGYLSSSAAPANQKLNLVLMILSGTIGGILGSIVTYQIGARGGRTLVEKYAHKLHLSKEKIAKSDAVFSKYGDKIVFFSRLLPIIRTFISLPAGIAKMNFTKFVLYTSLGSAVWSIVLGCVGYIMGKNWGMIRPYFHIADYLVAAIIIGFVIYKIAKAIIRNSKKTEE